jgi:hypothetical protein
MAEDILKQFEQRRADLTLWLEHRRNEYLRLKEARPHVTSDELREALAGYQQAVEALSQFLNEQASRRKAQVRMYTRPA